MRMAMLAGLLPLITVAPALAQGRPALHVWPEDPLVKVFEDAEPGDAGPARAEVARGEVASLQVVLRSAFELRDMVITCDDFTPATPAGALPTATAPSPLRARSIRRVGYVHVDRPIQKPGRGFLDRTPGRYPDPLLELDRVGAEGGPLRVRLPGPVAPNTAVPLWITVPIPIDTPPGEWTTQLTIAADDGSNEWAETQGPQATVALRIRVYAATLGRTRLWTTNWFQATSRHLAIDPAPDSPEFYALLRRYADNMAAHRQNVALISPLNLVQVTCDEAGKFVFDFARFDRWVDVFRAAGVVGRIEGGHFGGRSGNWESPFVIQVYTADESGPQRRSIAPDDPLAETFYSQFLPALVAHLRERGWLDSYMQHLADEPIRTNVASYRAMAELVRRHAPKLRIIEATLTSDVTGLVQVWVPLIEPLHRQHARFVERQAAGDEVWFYTCVVPQGDYANRFIEQPLILTRLLPWIAYRHDLTGYLHWGYNQWTADSPFEVTTRAHSSPPYLPAGDAWIVYPGREGPLDSLRWEAQRDGIDDHTLLSQLAEHSPAAAAALAASLVRDFADYELDVVAFRTARRELLKRLSVIR